MFAIVTAAWASALLLAQSPLPVVEPYPGLLHEHPAIAYGAAASDDPVAAAGRVWAERREAGTFDEAHGYLRDVLTALDIPVESQVAIFSKTALQQRYTSPRTPRAFYFNDVSVVGYIPGAPIMEIAAMDPRQGAVFYTVRQDPTVVPSFERRGECLTCHISNNTMEVPGFIARSMFADGDGLSHPQLGSALVDHRTPYAERWGGWFVTGAPEALAHLGNQYVGDPGVAPSPRGGVRQAIMSQEAVTRLPIPSSDVTALLVFDHQMHAANLLTRLGWEARIAAASGTPDFSSGSLGALVRETADYLSFADEPPLPGPIEGGSGFAARFAARGPVDGKGRSLRQLDRRTRLFRYPVSYMIDTPAFRALPDGARDALVDRMREGLEHAGGTRAGRRIPAADRAAAMEMLGKVRGGAGEVRGRFWGGAGEVRGGSGRCGEVRGGSGRFVEVREGSGDRARRGR